MHLNFSFILGLCALAHCLPSTNANAMRNDHATLDVPFADMRSAYNITHTELVASTESGVEKRRPPKPKQGPDDIGPDKVCTWFIPKKSRTPDLEDLYNGKHQLVRTGWRIQVPRSWYFPKYLSWDKACDDYYTTLAVTMHKAAAIVLECFDIKGGDRDGWIHMRFTTISKIRPSVIEAFLAKVADPRGMRVDPKPLVCYVDENEKKKYPTREKIPGGI